MLSRDLIELALEVLSCNQKTLALKLKVSSTQISKWKKGEYMSPDMEKALRALINIGDMDPAFIRWAGSLQQAKKWEHLIFYLATIANDMAETGYDTVHFTEYLDLLCGNTISILNDLGVVKPISFPEELDSDYEANADDDNIEDPRERFDQNPYSAFIYSIYKELNDVYGFYAAYISELVDDDELDLMNTPACNIFPCLMDLAASRVELDSQFAPNAQGFKRKVTRDYEEWLTLVKDRAFRAGIPLRAELLSLVYDSSDELRDAAEAESLGVNASRIHPDTYMNELLVGMRTIHQVLPAIMKKLGIYDEFQLNTSELRPK